MTENSDIHVVPATAPTRFLQAADKVVRGHGVVGNVTVAFVTLAMVSGVASWAARDATVAKTAIHWVSGVFVLYLIGVLVFSHLSPESAAMEGSQLLEWRLATKEGPLPDAPTVRSS